MTTARCTRPVQIYDDDLAGIYMLGERLEGAGATAVLARYPEYFEEVTNAE